MKMPANKDGKRVNFLILAQPESQVFVAGTFNNWDPTANQLQDKSTKGLFKTAAHISFGKHEYKFVVDGVWLADPTCLNRTPDTFGSENCVFEV